MSGEEGVKAQVVNDPENAFKTFIMFARAAKLLKHKNIQVNGNVQQPSISFSSRSLGRPASTPLAGAKRSAGLA